MFCGMRRTNHARFTEKWVMCAEKYVLVKKLFTNWLNMGCLCEPESKRKSIKCKNTDSQVMKKFRV